MESRWVYREVERLISKDLPDATYIHTELTKSLRRAVAETKDMLNILAANYVAKTAWAAGSKESSAVRAANTASASLFEALPYIGKKKRKNYGPVQAQTTSAEELMWKFIKRREAKKKAEEQAKQHENNG